MVRRLRAPYTTPQLRVTRLMETLQKIEAASSGIRPKILPLCNLTIHQLLLLIKDTPVRLFDIPAVQCTF